MLLEDYSVLNELLEEIKQETADVERRMDANFRRIREAETYIHTIIASESEDFKVFSPRRAEVLYREELQEAREGSLACVQENKKLAERRELLNGRICRLRELLDFLDGEMRTQTKEAEDFQVKTIQSLKALAEKIDGSSAWIERNPIQARQDFVIIGKCLRDLAERMEGMVRGEEENR